MKLHRHDPAIVSALLSHAEVLPHCIFASGNKRIKSRCPALVLDNLVTIQPVFDPVIRINNNPSVIPFTDFE